MHRHAKDAVPRKPLNGFKEPGSSKNLRNSFYIFEQIGKNVL